MKQKISMPYLSLFDATCSIPTFLVNCSKASGDIYCCNSLENKQLRDQLKEAYADVYKKL
ncbi:hypothetical protein CN561_27800 [Bacillus toyonensis]|nr:hypothetical protein CN561_27800 [Bacillus toyonensis]